MKTFRSLLVLVSALVLIGCANSGSVHVARNDNATPAPDVLATKQINTLP